MQESWKDRYRGKAGPTAVGLGFVAGAFVWFLILHYAFSTKPAEIRAEARQEWKAVSGRAISVSETKGSTADDAFREATFRFPTWEGGTDTKKVLVSWRTDRGQASTVWVSRHGKVVVKADTSRLDNPLDPYTGTVQPGAVLFGWIPAVVAWAISGITIWWGLVLLFGSFSWLRRTSVSRLIRQKMHPTLWRIRDEIRLRWEFFRKRRKVRETPFYKAARRFQAAIGRLDGTRPSVIEARRKANALMTKVLERDDLKAEDITREIAGIRAYVDEDINDEQEARRRAGEELAVAD